MSLTPIKGTSDAKKLLQERADSSLDLKGVIIIELYKDGSQQLLTSTFSMAEKCLLKCFFDSWIYEWFNSEEEEI